MDPHFWKDPEKFRPERFLDKESTIFGSENVISFGLGMNFILKGAMILINMISITFLNFFFDRFSTHYHLGSGLNLIDIS